MLSAGAVSAIRDTPTIAIFTLSPSLIAPVAIVAGRSQRLRAVLAIWPAILAIYFGAVMQTVATSGPLRSSLPWAESLGLTLSFYADGLGFMSAALIAGIGAHRYFKGAYGSR